MKWGFLLCPLLRVQPQTIKLLNCCREQLLRNRTSPPTPPPHPGALSSGPFAIWWARGCRKLAPLFSLSNKLSPNRACCFFISHTRQLFLTLSRMGWPSKLQASMAWAIWSQPPLRRTQITTPCQPGSPTNLPSALSSSLWGLVHPSDQAQFSGPTCSLLSNSCSDSLKLPYCLWSYH